MCFSEEWPKHFQILLPDNLEAVAIPATANNTSTTKQWNKVSALAPVFFQLSGQNTLKNKIQIIWKLWSSQPQPNASTKKFQLQQLVNLERKIIFTRMRQSRRLFCVKMSTRKSIKDIFALKKFECTTSSSGDQVLRVSAPLPSEMRGRPDACQCHYPKKGSGLTRVSTTVFWNRRSDL